ncbi:hypothetical protein [uncultured Massilia sp.]|uniref:hypothetical protein n=1 Tax=uncultured Massilia sp. TaxID=169973 RepID=UPI0025D2B31A|nr:hypothetical protein [uncultured Massilia sp.]
MIRIEKGPAPEELDEVNAELTKANLKIHKKHGAKTKVSSTKKKGGTAADTVYITAAYRSAEVKNRLVQTHFGKCAYCETRILSVSHGDVEHFRPKAKYTGESQTGTGYFWLAYDWRNLFLACDMCNETYKGTYFALMPAVEGLIASSRRLDAGEDVETDLEEDAVLIDPAIENPRAWLSFDVVRGTAEVNEDVPEFAVAAARVGKMVRELGLNRIDLVTARHRHIAFLRSMFIMACQDMMGSADVRNALFGVAGKIGTLKADAGSGEQSQKDLASYCESIYGNSPTTNLWQPPSRFGNALEAMRWLAFSVSPMAEFSALSQDCILAWMKELNGTSLQARGTTMGTPSSVDYTSSVNDRSWPPLSIAPVGAHRAALQQSLQAYMDGKLKMSNDMREAARQMYYNELNDLLKEINTFHDQKNFAPGAAADRYMGWYVDLEVINEQLEALGSSTCRGQRTALLAVLDEKIIAAGKAGLPDSDNKLQELYKRFGQWYGDAGLLEQCWQAALRIVTLGRELADRLEQVTVPPQQADDVSMMSDAPTIDVFDTLRGVADDLTALSPAFEDDIAVIQARYGEWLARTLTPQQANHALVTFLNPNAKRGQELFSLLQHYQPYVPQLLSAFRQTGALRDDIDDLIGRYNDAGIQPGSWRMETLHSISNILHRAVDARNDGKPALVDRSDAIKAPMPTRDDPSLHNEASTNHVYKPEPAIDWYVDTAKTRKETMLANRKGGNRKLGRRQQALVDEDTRVDALIASLQAQAKAQRAVAASFDDDGEIEHFASD